LEGGWYGPGDEVLGSFSDAFCFNDTAGFQTSLKSIELEYCGINDGGLEALLFKVLPSFPQLSSLSLRRNKIESLKSIVEKLRNGNVDKRVYKSKLRQLDLTSNYFCISGSGSTEKNIGVFRDFLCIFSTICDVPKECIRAQHSDDILFELLLNRAGRSLITGEVNNRPIPLSVWPMVLARIKNRIKNKNLSNIYFRRLYGHEDGQEITAMMYMLRNGPVLIQDRSRGESEPLNNEIDNCR